MSARVWRNISKFAVLCVFAGAVFAWPAALRHLLPAASPFIFLGSALAARHIGIAGCAALPMIAFLLWRRRAFCRYCCPAGWLLDGCARARIRAPRAYPRVPRVGVWVVWLTFGGALLSCPIFLFLDPLGIFTGAAGALRPPIAASRLAMACGLAALLGSAWLFPSLWCMRLCPLGATQELLADLALMLRNAYRYFAHLRENASGEHPENAGAPDAAEPGPDARGNIRLFRRGFLGAGAGILLAGAGLKWPRAAAAQPLRPPGAADEAALKTACIRCGNCMRSCPTGLIQPSLELTDPAGWLTPALDFRSGHCLDECNACGQNCPTGAIAALPLAEKNALPIGRARIDATACLLNVGQDCASCALICPRNAVLQDFSPKTYSVTVRIAPEICTGCGACAQVCPANAISIHSRNE